MAALWPPSEEAPGTVHARKRGQAHRVLDLGGAFGGGQVVDVRPVAVEEQVAGLERAAAFLFLVGDGFLRDVSVREGLHEVLQAGFGLWRIQARLAVLVEDGTAGGVDGLGGVDREAFVLLELAGEAADACFPWRWSTSPSSRPRSWAGWAPGPCGSTACRRRRKPVPRTGCLCRMPAVDRGLQHGGGIQCHLVL